jgi:leucyl aminopeptidase
MKADAAVGKVLDARCHGALRPALGRSEWKATVGAVQVVYPKAGPARLILLGLGSRAAGAADRLDRLRTAGARLIQTARDAGVKTLTLLPQGVLEEDDRSAEQVGRALGDGLALGLDRFEQFRGAVHRAGQAKTSAPTQDYQVALRVDAGDPRKSNTIAQAIDAALRVAPSVLLARQLAAAPPNVLTPKTLADQCRSIARKVGLKMRVIDAAKARALGMGGLVAVGAAGSTPPCLIALEWSPSSPRRGKGRSAAPILLVGKAVTFDTGGYSLKPTASMTGMKYDKCGGLAVIGALHAAAALQLPVPVVGLIPAAENLVATDAYRPDDILTFCNGVTCEVTNTDAEGRLILADALAYGTQHYQPRAVIDLATLTGGVVVALGDSAAGLFCGDETLRGQLQQAGDAVGERLWPLPLWDVHREMMKGAHADLVNSAERKAHPIQGAAFLSFFVGPDAPGKMPTLPWAHLDIAGVAHQDKDTALCPKGPTGWGVRLLVEWLTRWATAR